MPSPIAEQVKELEKTGFQVKKGIRQILRKPNDKAEVSGYWVHRWAKHACQNYPIVTRSAGIRYLKDACINIPTFIVGIGPSLDDNINELKQAKNRALIIATDAAVRPLLAKNIRPDLVMSFDCQKSQHTLWESIPKHVIYNLPLVINSCTHPHTILAWDGPILFYNQWHTADEFVRNLLPYIFPKIGSLPSAGTVGNMAVLLAHYMGCNPIYTMGFDLCYQERNGGWKYRCKDFQWDSPASPGMPGKWGETENKILYDNDQRISQIIDETIKSEKYKTDPALKKYRESLLGLTDGLPLPLVDCSIGGVLREYFRNASVTQAIMESCREELSEGRTIVRFLDKSVPHGTKLWERDKENGSNF